MCPDKTNFAWEGFDWHRIEGNKCVAIHRENKKVREIENTILQLPLWLAVLVYDILSQSDRISRYLDP